MRVEKIPLHVPALDDVAKVLQDSLQKNFASVSTSIVECPDLTQPPYSMAGKGICGNPRVADIGGTPYIMPTPEMDHVYDLTQLPGWTDMGGETFFLGAGATHTNPVDHHLCEMMPNVSVDASKNFKFASRLCHVKPDSNEYVLKDVRDSCVCRHLANLFVSEGKPGKVIELRAKSRTSSTHFLKLVQTALKDSYGDKPVVVGGVFVLLKGKANIHVMPCYSPTPLTCKQEVDDWLKFYDMSAPLVCTGYLVSSDPGYNLRMEHFHCYSSHGDGGHFHYDTTPGEAEYVAYFNVAETIYRIDRWDKSHHTIDYAD